MVLGELMDLNTLQELKNKIEKIKAEKAKCAGQEQQLNVQKEQLIAEFKELGVTKDTLPLTIAQLEKDIKSAEDEIDLVLAKLGI